MEEERSIQHPELQHFFRDARAESKAAAQWNPNPKAPLFDWRILSRWKKSIRPVCLVQSISGYLHIRSVGYPR